MSLKRQFVVQDHGKEFVLYAGLLDEAHAQGLRRIETRLLQIPTADNGELAVVSAVVETEKGTFAGLGDASPANVKPHLRAHLIRLAETRAKARALRDAINVSMAAYEELGEEPSDHTEGRGARVEGRGAGPGPRLSTFDPAQGRRTTR